MRGRKSAKRLPVRDLVTMAPLVALLGSDLTASAIPIMSLGQRGGANAHQPTDSGFGMPRFQGGDCFLAQVETIGGRHQQFSKLTPTLIDLTLLRIAIDLQN